MRLLLARTDDDYGGVAEVMGAEPTPEMAVEAAESCGTLLGLLPDDQLRRIAVLKLEGYSNSEIAEQLDVVERTVERKLSRIRSIWNETLDSSGN